MTQKTPITIARGDGIGPAIMEASLKILDAAGAQLDYHEIEVGEKLYLSGHSAGIEENAWDTLRETGILFKAPITTPFGGGYKSLNVTIRKTLGLYANVRPAVSYHPFVKTNFPGMDIVIIRENEEDLYAGIEHRQSANTYQCLKLITRPGSERICRYAFEYARANGRKKVTCMVKDNIMKLADGMFYEIFQEVAKDYPEIENDRIIVDIGAARVAARPSDFDVIVTLNLYGDIISDIAAEVTGSVGLGGSCNLGEGFAMFEAIHGSAPDIAGKGIANPSGLILGSVLMLTHIGQRDVAEKIHNAWLKTLEDGIHTGDIYRDDTSKEKASTERFTQAVIERLGQKPSTMTPVSYPSDDNQKEKPKPATLVTAKKELVGVDLFIEWDKGNGIDLGDLIDKIETPLKLITISNRGTKVWPGTVPGPYRSDHWTLRFRAGGTELKPIQTTDVLGVQQALIDTGYDVVKTENLYTFDGQPGFSLAQGQ